MNLQKSRDNFPASNKQERAGMSRPRAERSAESADPSSVYDSRETLPSISRGHSPAAQSQHSQHLKQSNSTGKVIGSNHTSTARTLQLMKELQDQLLVVERVAADRKAEVDRLKREKRTLIQENKSRQGAGMSKWNWDVARSADLPAPVRIILEDSKVLQEKVKRYKGRLHASEQTITAQQAEMARLQTDLAHVRQTLRDCKRTPDEAATERNLSEQLERRERAVRELEAKVGVLTHAREAEAKRHRQDAAEAVREREALEGQIAELKGVIEERDKEIRGHLLSVKQMQRKVENRMTLLQRKRLEEEETRRAREAAEAEVALQERAARAARGTDAAGSGGLHVMLCIISPQPDAKEPAPGSLYTPRGISRYTSMGLGGARGGRAGGLTPGDAATAIQAVFRGHQVRESFKEEREAARQQEAVIKIQARARGMLARQQVAEMRQGQLRQGQLGRQRSGGASLPEGAATAIQAAARGHAARSTVHRMREEAAISSSSASGGREAKTVVSTRTAARQSVSAPKKPATPQRSAR